MHEKSTTGKYPSSECRYVDFSQSNQRPHFLHGLIKHKKSCLYNPGAEGRVTEDVSLQGLPRNHGEFIRFLQIVELGDRKTKFSLLSERCRKAHAHTLVIYPPIFIHLFKIYVLSVADTVQAL